jgi:hypothetical protein
MEQTYTTLEKLSAIKIYFERPLTIGDPRYQRTFKQCLEETRKRKEEKRIKRIKESYRDFFNG